MKKNVTIICASIMVLTGCTTIKTTSLPIYSAQISFFDKSAKYDEDDQIMKCQLSDTATLNEYKCISWISFFEDGHIKQFETAVDIKRTNYVIPSRSIIFFNDQNHTKIKCIWFSKNVTINNIECKGGGKTATEFYDNDSLKACFLTKDQTIQGYLCKSSLLKPVFFYQNGKVRI